MIHDSSQAHACTCLIYASKERPEPVLRSDGNCRSISEAPLHFDIAGGGGPGY